ncbi:hypothetical protein BV20DRAFT_1055885 [Pilatotrama ljubarskyi]|nr:hypothetical protein BV20DRAFT_1055885 [Pilatotrama ljubarskyi]
MNPQDDAELYEEDDEDEDVEELIQVAPRTRAEVRSNAAAGTAASDPGSDHQNALYALQLSSQKQQDRIRELELKLAAAEAQRTKRSRKSKTPATDTPPSDDPTSVSATGPAEDQPEILRLTGAIAQAGRKYAFVVRAWPPPRSAWQYTERPLVDPLDASARYPKEGSTADKDEALSRAYAAEIYDMLPAVLHPHLTNDFIICEFTKKINDQKSKIISKARGVRHQIFKDTERLTLSVFASVSTMESDPTVLEYRSTADDLYPPIIFPAGKAGKAKYLFMSTSIAWFIRVALFGPSSMDYTDDDSPNAKQHRPQYNVAAILWNIQQLTPGMIAFAAVAVRHLLYPEEDFDTKGSASNVPYERFFNEYVKILISYWTGPRIGKVRDWLTARVFRNIKSYSTAAGGAGAGIGHSADALDLDELNDPESSDDDDDNVPAQEERRATSSSVISYASRGPAQPQVTPASLATPNTGAAPIGPPLPSFATSEPQVELAHSPSSPTARSAFGLPNRPPQSVSAPVNTAAVRAHAFTPNAQPYNTSDPNQLALSLDEVSLSGESHRRNVPLDESPPNIDWAPATAGLIPEASTLAPAAPNPVTGMRKGPVKPRKLRAGTMQAPDASGGSHEAPLVVELANPPPPAPVPAAAPLRRSTRPKKESIMQGK